MKKSLLLIGLILASCSFLEAQDQLFVIPLKKDKIPPVVMSSIEKDFPESTVTDYSAIPIQSIGEDWAVVRNDVNQDKYDTYQVDIDGNAFAGTATYDANGRLISARENLKNVILPHQIGRSIGAEYPGWAVAGDHELITVYKPGRQQVYYRVKLEKGREKMTVVYDGSGNQVKPSGAGDYSREMKETLRKEKRDS